MASEGRGRDPARERFWWEKVEGQTASGLSVGAYCRRHRLRPSAPVGAPENRREESRRECRQGSPAARHKGSTS